MVAEQVRSLDEPYGLADEDPSFLPSPLACEDLAAHASPEDLRREVVRRCGPFAHIAEPLCLVGAPLSVDGLREHGRGGREQRVLTHLLEPVVAEA